MKDISRRDYFAATADVSWLKGEFGELANLEFIAEKAGINVPASPMTIRQLTNFLSKAEIAWRWRYADLMLRGRDS